MKQPSLFLLLCAATLSTCQILFCGTAPYYPADYTCYNNNILCPILYGQPTLPCNSACYSPDMYQCAGGQLQLLPQATTSSPPFKLQVRSSNPALNGLVGKVCGLAFNVGAA